MGDLTGLKNLGNIVLCDAVVPGLDWVAGTSIEMFGATNIQDGMDYSPLSACQNLTWISINTGNAARADLGGLGPKKLEMLELYGGEQLRECRLDGLRECARLKTLTLNSLPLQNLDFLDGMKGIRKLHINGLPISDLTPVTNSRANLWELYLIRNEVLLWPKGLNLDAYRTVLGNERYIHSLWYTALLTLGCTVLSLFMTVICAYPLTYDQLKGRKFLNGFILFTMYFSAGMIPHYVMLSNMGMLETVWVLVIPSCLSVYNMIIMRSSFYSVPESLREAAEIDGAGPIRILVQVYLPLSKPVLATLALFYAVGRWNGFSDALLYIKKTRELYPIQLYLYNILQNASSGEAAAQEGFAMPGLSETLKMASVMFATVPILLVYPWLQRYFVSGVTIGAVKG